MQDFVHQPYVGSKKIIPNRNFNEAYGYEHTCCKICRTVTRRLKSALSCMMLELSCTLNSCFGSGEAVALSQNL